MHDWIMTDGVWDILSLTDTRWSFGHFGKFRIMHAISPGTKEMIV